MSDDAIKDAIEANVATPQSVSAGGVSVTAKSLADQIAAAKHIAAQNALANPATALAAMRAQARPPEGV